MAESLIAQILDSAKAESTHFLQMKSTFYKRRGFALLAGTILLGLLLPENPVIPVKQATPRDWNHQSFWHYPWGKSGVHKGIDIFAPKGRDVVAATGGLVLWKGELARGGKAVVVLGPKWRCHYYAHLDGYQTHFLDIVSGGEPIGYVGTTGNAAGKSPHLHYSVSTLLPYVWRWDNDRQGWKKMFYLDPHKLLTRE